MGESAHHRGVPGRASDDLLIQAATTISRLRYISHVNGLVAEQVRDSVTANVIAPSYFNILDREGSRSEIVSSVRARPACLPLNVASPP